MIELALVLTLLAATFVGMSGYFQAYLRLGEEATVAQSLQLGRLNIVPAIVVRDATGKLVLNTAHAALLAAYLRASFVSRELLMMPDTCTLSGDYVSFVVREVPQYDGMGVFTGYSSNFLSGVVDCRGVEIIPKADLEALIPPGIHTEISNFVDDGLGHERTLVVVYSALFPHIGAIIRDAEDHLSK